MKLVRYGAKGAEKPGLIDKSGQLRDLSAHVKDLDGEAYAPASLAKLAAPRSVQASRRRRQAAVRRAGHRHLEIRRHRPELRRPRQGNRQSDPDRADLLPEGQHRALAARTTRSKSRAARPSSTGKSRSPPSSAPAPNTSREADALNHVAGYCVCNDVSERNFQIERLRPVDQGQVARHLWPGRPVARHQGRNRRTCRSCRCGSTSTASAARPDRPRP